MRRRKRCGGGAGSRGVWAAEEVEGSGAKCSHAVHVSAARNPWVCVDLGGCWTMERGPVATNSSLFCLTVLSKALRKPLQPSHRSPLLGREGKAAQRGIQLGLCISTNRNRLNTGFEAVLL